jgi:tetratricopeptide (TPR) repeat protein
MINLERYGEASAAIEEALVLAREARDSVAVTRLCALLGFAALYMHDVETAFERFSEAGDFAFANNRDRDAALVCRGFAEIALVRGDPQHAVEMSSRALHLLQRIENFRGIDIGRYQLAQSLLAAGRLEEARDYARQAVRALGRAEIPLPFVESLAVMSAVYEGMRDDVRAGRLLGYCRARAASLRFRSGYLIQSLADTTLREITARLGPTEVSRLLAIGAELSEPDAVSEACGR